MRTLIAAAVVLLGVLAPARAGVEPFVLVSTNTEIHKFSLTGQSLGVWVPGSSEHLAMPQHMAMGPDGNIYVANFGGGVEVFDVSGAHVRSLPDVPGMTQPAWLGFRGDTLLVSAIGSARVLAFDVLQGDAQLPDPFTIPGELSRPHAILFDEDEALVSLFPGTVARFGADGQHVENFLTTSLVRPLTILRSADESRLIVSDFNGRVQSFDAQTGEHLGRFTSDVGGAGSDGMTYLPNGNVLIAFFSSRFVKEYTPDGDLVGIWGDASWATQGPNDVFVVLPAPAGVAALAPLAGILLARRRRR